MLQLLRQHIICFTLLVCPLFAWSHGGIHEEINRISKKIEKDPTNALLYIKRGEYYKEDRNFDKAFADYQTAKNLDNEITTIEFLLAELFYSFEYHHSALASIDAFLKQEKNIAECYLLKAKIFHELFAHDSALIYAEAAYPHHNKPTSKYFVQVKDYVLYADSTNFEKASKWLAEGKKRIPRDLAIREEFVHLAIQFKEYSIAKETCAETIPLLKRKEYWYYLLAKAYQKDSDQANASKYFELAKASIAKLPRHHKNTAYIRNLQSTINKDYDPS